MPAFIRISFLLVLGFQYTNLSSQLLTHRYEIIPFRETASGAQSMMHSLVEDPEGYIWIGTQDGLYRYDGFAFTAFEPPEDLHGQHGLHIMKIQIIKDYLYAASSRGLHLVHLPTLISKTINLGDDGTNNSFNNLIFDIQEDHSGTIWLITPSALHKINYPDQKRESYPLPDSLVTTGRTLSTQSRLTCLQNGEIWIEISPHNRKDLTLIYNQSTETFEILDLVPANSEDHIVQLDPFNICYVALPEHPTIATINPQDGTLQPIELPAGFLEDYPIITVLPLNTRTIQLTVRGKKWLFDLPTRKLNDPGWPIYLEDPDAGVKLPYNLYRTLDGTTIGYCSKGLIRFIDEHRIFKPFHQLDELFSMHGNPLTQIWSNDTIIWAGHYGDGGVLLNNDGFFLRHVYLGEPRPFEMSNYWWNISRYNMDTFWIGTSGGLFWYTLSGHQGRVIRPGLPDGLLKKGILTQFTDSRDELWMGIGGGNGAVRWSTDRRSTKYYPVRSGGLPFRYPKVIVEDSKGDLWMGCQTGGGLVRWDHTQDTFEVVKSNADSIFVNDLIESIIIHENDRIYFGGRGGGLYEFDPQNRIFRNWSARHGLSNNYVEDLEWDRHGNLWIATRNGLNKLDLSTNQISVFYTIHGLPSNQVSFIQKQTDSTFYILTTAGTRVLNPDHLTTDTLHKPVRISHLEVNGVVMNELLQQKSNHRLNYHQNNLTFKISQVNLKDGILNQYQYRFIDRHPNNWEPLNAGNQLVLLGLSPGNYPFQFRVCNNNQCRSTEVIEFRILPPFWRSIWFFLLLIILLTTIILGYTRLHIRNLIRQQNLRNQISADLHDDIGSSLSSIRFMTEMMTPDPKDLIQERRLEAIKEEIGQINQNLEEIIWYIKPTSDTLQEIHLKLRRFSWDLLESKGIQLFWEEPKSFGAHKFNSRQKRDYFLFFKEVMNNAAKHSQAKTVRVAITFEDRQFSITITDDGVGFDPDQAVDSNGMQTIKTRAARLNGKLTIRSSKSKGATLTLQLPLQ